MSSTTAPVLDPDALHQIMVRQGVEAKIAALQSLKSYAKRNPINLSYAMSYFETIRYVVQSPDTQLHSLAHSCNGHLIKRIITQNPSYLPEILEAAIPTAIDGLADSKPSIKSSSASIIKDVWAFCPERLDPILRDVGLSSSSPETILSCLDLLLYRITSTSNVSFKPFTSTVVSLLCNQTQQVRVSASKVLTTFFSTARDVAKGDLQNELTIQGVDPSLAENILSSVNFTPQQAPSSTVSNSPTASSESKALNIDFFLKDPKYEIEEFPIEDCHSLERFKREITIMSPYFEGKETEGNWTKREASITKLRGLVRGNIAQEYPEQFCLALKEIAQGVIKAASSLRTVLSTAACQFIKECFMILGSSLDSVSDVFLSATIKFAALTKKITSMNGMAAASVIVIKSSYSLKAINLIQSTLTDRNPQPRIFAAKLIRIELYRHRTIKSIVDSSGGREIMEKCILKGLNDANTEVRKEMRLAFWGYNELWPSHAANAISTLDSATRKGLERENPSGQPIASAPSLSRPRPQSSIREFIMQSRERNSGSRTELRQEPQPQPRARLGMPQRTGVRTSKPVVKSTVRSTSSTSFHRPTPETDGGRLASKPRSFNANAGSTDENDFRRGGRQEVHAREAPESRRSNSSSSLSSTSSGITTQPTFEMPVSEAILEGLSSDNPTKTGAGVQLLLDTLSLNDSQSSLPPVEHISRTLHRLFINKRRDPAFQPPIYSIISDTKGFDYLSQIFSPTELALSVIYSSPSPAQGYSIMERIVSEVEPEKRLSLATYLISHRFDSLGKEIGNDLYALKSLEAVRRGCSKIKLDNEGIENIKLLTLYLPADKDGFEVNKVFDEIKKDLGYGKTETTDLPEDEKMQDTPSQQSQKQQEEEIAPENVPIPETPDVSLHDIDPTPASELAKVREKLTSPPDLKDSAEIPVKVDVQIFEDEQRQQQQEQQQEQQPEQPVQPVHEVSLEKLVSGGFGHSYSPNHWENFENQIHSVASALHKLSPHDAAQSYAKLVKNLKSNEITDAELNSLMMVVRSQVHTEIENKQEAATNAAAEEASHETSATKIDNSSLAHDLLVYASEQLESLTELKAKKVLSILSAILEQDGRVFVGQEEQVFAMVVGIQKLQQQAPSSQVGVVGSASPLSKYILLHGGVHLLSEMNKQLTEQSFQKVTKATLSEILERQYKKKPQEERQMEVCYTYLDILLKQKKNSIVEDAKEESGSDDSLREFLPQLGQTLAQGLSNEYTTIRKMCYMILQTLGSVYKDVASGSEVFHKDILSQLDKESIMMMEYISSSPSFIC